MARKIRIEDAGFHHILNRGVERRVIFNTAKDKEKFLDIVCEVSEHYDFTIHGYVLMSNHYHLLLENSRENLSAGMRQINSSYAQYYNKKYKRTGHLWQDRFKSWYLFDENYLFTLFRYLEFNPIEAKISKKVGEYHYTLMHDIVQKSVRACMKDSFVLQWYDSTNELLESVGIKMTEEEKEKISQFQKEATAYKTKSKKIQQRLKLEDYFKKDISKLDRNEAILKAWQDGFMQSEIAKFLELSDAGVSKILKKLKVKT
jgi:REP element-mobilizing transposase RayT